MNTMIVKDEPSEIEREITEMASRILEHNKQKATRSIDNVQLRRSISNPSQSTIMSYFQSNESTERYQQYKLSTQETNNQTRISGAIDYESECMRYGFHIINKVIIPYINRNGEPYCPVRVIEKFILEPFLNRLPMDVCNCTLMEIYPMTEHELHCINVMNSRHCLHYYGREAFTNQDCVVHMVEVKNFSEFLILCERKMLHMTSKPDDKCGFLRINGESVVPYTMCYGSVDDREKWHKCNHDEEKLNKKKNNVEKEKCTCLATCMVPLFYFEGETDHLKCRAVQLDGWELACLKLCCKVQGIRSELFQNNSCEVVSVDDVKRHFPLGTVFEPWWPSKSFEFDLTEQPKACFWRLMVSKTQKQISPTYINVNQSKDIYTGTNQSNLNQEVQSQYSAISRNTATSLSNSCNEQINSSTTNARLKLMLSSKTSIPTSHRNVVNQTRLSATSNQSEIPHPMIYKNVCLPNTLKHLPNYHANKPGLTVNKIMPQLQQSTRLNYNGNINHRLSSNAMSQQRNPSNITQNSKGVLFHARLPHLQQIPTSNQFFTQRTSNTATVRCVSTPRTAPSLQPRPASVQNNTISSSNDSISSRLVASIVPIENYTAQNNHHRSQIPNTSFQGIQGGNSHRNGTSIITQHDSSILNRSGMMPMEPPGNFNLKHRSPYIVQKTNVERCDLKCINIVPYDYQTMCVSLHDLVAHVFPKISVKDMQDILDVLKIQIRRANDEQTSLLRIHGSVCSLDNVLGLVKLSDILSFMPQIVYIYTRHQKSNPISSSPYPSHSLHISKPSTNVQHPHRQPTSASKRLRTY